MDIDRVIGKYHHYNRVEKEGLLSLSKAYLKKNRISE